MNTNIFSNLDQTLKQRHEDNCGVTPEAGDYTEYVYFVTMRARSMFRKPQTASLVIFKEFKGFYVKLCQSVISGKYGKKRNLQPRVVAFLDADGSRGFLDRAIPQPGTHVHAVCLVHPKVHDRFKQFVEPANLDGLLSKWSMISSIDIRKFDASYGTVSNLIEYSAKTQTKLGSDDWWIFPE